MYRFEKFELDPRRGTLFRTDSPTVRKPSAFLFFLLQQPNRLVREEELLELFPILGSQQVPSSSDSSVWIKLGAIFLCSMCWKTASRRAEVTCA